MSLIADSSVTHRQRQVVRESGPRCVWQYPRAKSALIEMVITLRVLTHDLAVSDHCPAAPERDHRGDVASVARENRHPRTICCRGRFWPETAIHGQGR